MRPSVFQSSFLPHQLLNVDSSPPFGRKGISESASECSNKVSNNVLCVCSRLPSQVITNEHTVVLFQLYSASVEDVHFKY